MKITWYEFLMINEHHWNVFDLRERSEEIGEIGIKGDESIGLSRDEVV